MRKPLASALRYVCSRRPSRTSGWVPHVLPFLLLALFSHAVLADRNVHSRKRHKVTAITFAIDEELSDVPIAPDVPDGHASAVRFTSSAHGADLAMATSQAWSLMQRNMLQSQLIPGLGMGKELLKIMALCACCVIAFKMISSFLGSRRGDLRRCSTCARFLLWIGWDEFECFDVIATVHSVQDIKKDGLLGEKEFKITIQFRWSKFETTPTKDCRWDQTKGMEVPQGSSECTMTLWSLGSFRDSKVGSNSLFVKKQMLDNELFWGRKQKFKMESKGKAVGTLLCTFRKKGEGDDGGLSDLPISGIDMESGLAIEVLAEWEKLCDTPGYAKPEGKLEGEEALFLLSKVLTDDLREISSGGKELGKVFIRVVNCNFADLQGDNRDEELQKQIKKAKKKGVVGLEKKWYWCWYEDERAGMNKWTHPDGFIPLSGISNVHRAPERHDEFLIKYSSAGSKDFLRYRRESGKGLDVWVDGLDIAYQSARNVAKKVKEAADKEEEALRRMQVMHKQWVQTRGMPSSQAEWKEWFDYFKANNYDEELINKTYQSISKQG